MREPELLECEAIVKGNVQGVGFRATANLFAQQLKLTGFVRNLSDGSVEICAQGEKAQLDKLFEKLRKEFGGYIQDISLCSRKISERYPDFRVL